MTGRTRKKKLGEVAQVCRPSGEFDRTTFEDLKKLYLSNFEKKRKRDREMADLAIKHPEGTLKECRAIDITEGLIEEYSQKRLQGPVSPTTVNRELSVLRAMFHLGVRYKMVSADRAPFIEMPSPSEPRRGFIEREQYEKLLAALPEWLKPILTFVFRRMRSTGGTCTERKENKHPERIGNFKKIWVKACKEAGLEGLLFHDLRRSAIREMVRNGYSERVAMEISGHKTRSVSDRYNIVDLEAQKAAAARRIENIPNNYS